MIESYNIIVGNGNHSLGDPEVRDLQTLDFDPLEKCGMSVILYP
jgi:hypothetical protein